MVAIGGVTVFCNLHHVEPEFGANVRFRIVGIGNFTSVLGPELGKFQRHDLVDDGMPHVIGGVMRQRPQREGVLVDVGRFFDQGGNEFSAAHIVQQVAEIFIAAGVVTHVLNQAAAVGIGVRLPKVVCSGLGKPVQEHRLNLVLPRQIHDFFVSEDRVGPGRYGTEGNGKQNRASDQDRARSFHAGPLDAEIDAACRIICPPPAPRTNQAASPAWDAVAGRSAPAAARISPSLEISGAS